MKKRLAIVVALSMCLLAGLVASPGSAGVSLVIQNALSSQAAQQAITQGVASANGASGSVVCPYVVEQSRPAAPTAAVEKLNGFLRLLRRLRFW